MATRNLALVEAKILDQLQQKPATAYAVARLTHLSLDTVFKAIRRLELRGAVRVVQEDYGSFSVFALADDKDHPPTAATTAR